MVHIMHVGVGYDAIDTVYTDCEGGPDSTQCVQTLRGGSTVCTD